jgi:hypothetical protein
MNKLLLLILLPLTATAITPPAPVAPKLESVLYSWTPATTRNDGSPMAASERRETRLYVTALSAYIAVPEPAANYTYILPAGQCFKTTDAVAATTVDTDGRESAASISVSASPRDMCGPKALPAAPTTVKAATGS